MEQGESLALLYPHACPSYLAASSVLGPFPNAHVPQFFGHVSTGMGQVLLSVIFFLQFYDSCGVLLFVILFVLVFGVIF